MEVGKARIEVGTPKDLKVGATVRVDGHEYLIEEVGQAECVGIEGQLPSDILPGEVYRYADGSTPGRGPAPSASRTTTCPWCTGRLGRPRRPPAGRQGVEW